MIRFNRLTVLSLTAALLIAHQPLAQAVNRASNQANGDWNNATHWTPNGVPTSADLLTIGSSTQNPSTMSINGGNAQSQRLYIGGSGTHGAGTGTLNLNAGTNLWTSEYLYLGADGIGGTNNGTLNMTSAQMLAQNGLYAARQSANSQATFSLNNSQLNIQGTNDNTYITENTGTRATFNLNNGSVMNIGNTGGNTTGGGTAASVIIGGNNQNSFATFNIDATSQLNQGMQGGLFIRGGDPAGPTIHGLTGHAVYTLPLSNQVSDGHFSTNRQIYVGDQSNRVVLNLDSTLAPGLASAPVLNQFGDLRMANLSNGSAQLNLNAVDLSFYSGHMYMAAVNQGESNMRTTVNLTNSSLNQMAGGLDIGKGATTTNGTINLVNSTFNILNSINVGRDSSNTGTATFSIDANSQLNMLNGGLFLQGGNAGGNATYNLAISDTASNGRMSFDRGLSVAQSPNNNITLNLNGATSAATNNQYGSLVMARGGNSTGILTITDMDMTFRGNQTMQIANQEDQGNQQGTLTLTNSTVFNSGGVLQIGKGATTTLGTINLVNSDFIMTGGFDIGRGGSNTGRAVFNIDSNSRMIMENGALSLQGGNNGGNATYDLAISDAPSLGRLSFDRGIAVAPSGNNNITLNLNASTSVATNNQYGSLVMARGTNSTGTVTITDMDMTFRGNQPMQIANQEDQSNQQGTLTLTNSTVFNSGGVLQIGKGASTTLGTINLVNSDFIMTGGFDIGRVGQNTGRAVFNIDSNSRMIMENGALSLQGGNNGGNATYNLAVSDAPSLGRLSFDRGLAVAPSGSNNITLNLNAATSVATNHQFGGLTIARGTNATGILSITDMDMTFRNTTLQIANEQNSNNQQGTLSLTNSTLFNPAGGMEIGKGRTTTVGTINLVNSQLILRDSINVGRDSETVGTAAFNIDSTSRLVMENGGLFLRGGLNGANQTYNLAISNAPSDGRMSFDRGLTVADTANNRITLNLNSATSVATNNQFGGLTIGRQQDAIGILNLTGMDMRFHNTTLQMANEQNNNNQQATLAMTNSSFWNTAGGLDVGRGQTTTTATINLVNSTLNARDGLLVGRDGSTHGRLALSLDATSQLNFLNGSIDLRGGNNGGLATYNMNLTDSYNTANNHVSFNRSLSVGSHSTSPFVELTSTSSARAMLSGDLYVGFNGSTARGTLNLDGTQLLFSSNGGMANNGNNRGYVNLNSGAGFEVANDFSMRSGANATAAAAVTMNGGSESRLDGGNSFNMSGRVANNSSGNLLIDFGALSSSVSGTGNVTQGDTTLSGWVVNGGTGGEMVLKSLRGVTNSYDTTWGQQTAGTTPSLVNAMRVTFGGADVTTTGDLSIAALDREAFGAATGRVGAYSIQTDNGLVLANGPTVQIRYDSSLGATEANLRVWQLVGGVWTDVTAGAPDTTNKRISANLDVALGNIVIAETQPASTTPIAHTAFDGNRAAGQTVRFNQAAGGWDTVAGDWTDTGTGVNVRRAVGPETRDAVIIGSTALASANVTLDNGVENRIRSLTLGEVTGTSVLTVDGVGTSLRITSSDVQAAVNAGNSTATFNVQDGALLHIDNSLNLATNTNNVGNLNIDDARVQITNNLLAGRGVNSVANIALTNGASLDIRGVATVGADDGNQNGKAVISLDATSQMDILHDLNLRGREAGPAQAVYTLPLTDTANKGAGFLSVGRTLNVADGGNTRVDLIVDSTLAPGLAASSADLNFSGELNIGSGGSSVGNVTFNEVNATFGGGNHRVATGGNFTSSLSLTDSNLTFMGELLWADANASNTIADINLVGSTINTRGSINIGRSDAAQGRADISIDGTSQVNTLSDLRFRGGFNGANTTYNLGLSDTPTDGMLSFRNSLQVGDGGNSRVTLNVDSTGAQSAGEVSAATAYFNGELNVGNGGNAIGILNLHNVDWSFGGGNHRVATGGNFTSQLNLTNSTLDLMGNVIYADANANNSIAQVNLVNSTINARGQITIGRSDAAQGRADISIDSNSQLNGLSDLLIRGGFNGGNQTYNLALTDTPTNGKLSFRNTFNVGDGGNNKVTVNIDSTGAQSAGQSSAATAYFNGELNVGSGGNSTGILNLHNVDWSFGGGNHRVATGGNFTSQLNLTNSTLDLMGNVIYADVNANNSIAQVNLVNSTINARGQITIGRSDAAQGRADISIDSSSQLNGLSDLLVRGGFNGANHTYNLALADTPTNGMLSFRNTLNVGDGGNNRVTLNVDSTGAQSAGQASAATSYFNGELNIGSGGNSTGILNMHNVDWSFGGGTMRVATGGNFTSQLNMTNSTLDLMGSMEFARANANNTIAQVNLVNSTINSRGQLIIGTDNEGRGRANITLDGTSQFNLLSSLHLRGGDNLAVANYTLPLASRPEAGKMSFLGNFAIADTNNNRINLTVDSTLAPGQAAATDMSFNGSFSMSNGNGANSTLTVRETTMRFNGAGNLSQNVNAQSRIIMDDANLEFYGGMTLRNQTSSSAEIIGTGSISVGGTLNNSGRIVADGGDLVLRANTVTRNAGISITQATGGYDPAGWFAYNGGELFLPDQYVTGTSNSNWGGNVTDANPILVNSMRFTAFTNLQPGIFSGSVMAPDHVALPLGLVNIVSAWDFSGLTFDDATMRVRYDDSMAASLAVDENDLKLWHYTGGTWVDITSALDITNNWIDSIAITSLSPFAVATDYFPPPPVDVIPEPGTYALGLLGLVGMGLFIWRKRRNK